MKPEDIMLSEISQSQKDKGCMISLTRSTQSSQIHRQETEWWLPGAEGDGIGELLLTGMEFPFCKMKGSDSCKCS